MIKIDYSTETKKFWRKQIKHRAVLSLGNECCVCHNQFEDCCYDLHHMAPEEKDFTISSQNANGAKSWDKIRDEIRKCALVCSNCHRLLHNNFATLEVKQYFDETYYHWDITEAKQISKKTLLPLDKNCICPECGGIKGSTSTFCQNCSRRKQTKVTISREELKELIRTISFKEISDMFEVSDRTIRNHCKKMNLPTSKNEINSYPDEGWDKI